VRQLCRDQHPLADVVIEPKIAHIRPDQIKLRPELIRLGEQAATEKLDEIRAAISRAR